MSEEARILPVRPIHRHPNVEASQVESGGPQRLQCVEERKADENDKKEEKKNNNKSRVKDEHQKRPEIQDSRRKQKLKNIT